MNPSAQGGERDNQFGGVSEGSIEQTAHAVTCPVRQLLGGPAQPSGKRQDRDRGRDEHQ